MIKVTKFFLKAMHSAFLLKIIECSELGYIEKEFSIIIEDVVVVVEVKEVVGKKSSHLVIVENEELGD